MVNNYAVAVAYDAVIAFISVVAIAKGKGFAVANVATLAVITIVVVSMIQQLRFSMLLQLQ